MILFIIALVIYLNFGSLKNCRLEILLDMSLIAVCWVLLNIDSWLKTEAA